MPDASSFTETIHEIVRDMTRRVVQAVKQEVNRAVEEQFDGGDSAPTPSQRSRTVGPKQSGTAKRAQRSSASRKSITRWVPDVRARRVPTFVIKATGLKTKKEIVEKYGDKAVFEDGKPAPKLLKA